MLSDYFHMTLDELVKDIDVHDVRVKNLTDEKIALIFDDVKKGKSTLRTVKQAFTAFAVFGWIAIAAIIIGRIVLNWL